MEQIRQTFAAELEEGLRLTDAERTGTTTSMLMINTFVPPLQSIGDRSQLAGPYVALDIGSTNFRVLYTPIDADSMPDATVKYYDIPREYRKGDSSKVGANSCPKSP